MSTHTPHLTPVQDDHSTPQNKDACCGAGSTGLDTAWTAAFADVGASLLVLGNELRLLHVRKEG